MTQSSTTSQWDLTTINTPVSNLEKTYILLMLLILVVVAIKLIRVWRMAPPFRSARIANNPAYLRVLRSTAASLQNWIALTLLAWGLYTSLSITRICEQVRLVKTVGAQLLAYFVLELSITTTMALLVALLAFLIRWHIMRRLDLLHSES